MYLGLNINFDKNVPIWPHFGQFFFTNTSGRPDTRLIQEKTLIVFSSEKEQDVQIS
jgi:hypothetical protein